MAIKSTIVGGKQGIPEWMFPCLGKTGDGIGIRVCEVFICDTKQLN